ncbi:glycogenin-1 [Trichonephila clavata]|uniref:glycogenin glucosyltransferase n=1 Tax=Trichonephila clavata TaxID=2740835 RepID=A0A8X6FIR0_TRICU|nr:glycogenin-1 [Trichonephila clavata]
MAESQKDTLNEKERNESFVARTLSDCKPCLKHAAENISRKITPDVNNEDSLCKNCSKTILSYIFLIQDMLDGLARKVYCDQDSSHCIQCLRKDSRITDSLTDEKSSPAKDISDFKNESSPELNGYSEGNKTPGDEKLESNPDLSSTSVPEVSAKPKKSRKVSSRRNSRRISMEVKENFIERSPESYVDRDGWQTNFLYNVSPATDSRYPSYTNRNDKLRITVVANEKCNSTEDVPIVNEENKSVFNGYYNNNTVEASTFVSNTLPLHPDSLPDVISNDSSKHYEQQMCYKERNLDYHDEEADDLSNSHSFDSKKCPESSMIEENEKIISPVETENEVITHISNPTTENCNTLHESLSKHTPTEDQIFTEAFVTICRSNAEALGCLVLGSSLLLSRTTKQLCVLVFDGVDTRFKELLSSVFHVVRHVRSLSSVNGINFDYPDLIGLEILNIWRLLQFKKCVFLNPDCLVLRNCDELFQYDELSAVPDTGWPDCFNSGVFVFVPSLVTFTKLVELSKTQGQNNGGDQILLNTYFNTWSSDISKKLSFIYNLMQNSSYTYTPALERFGQNVKIVQFLGTSKPWQVNFFTHTSQIAGDVDLHSKHVRFIAEWINIFKVAVLRLLPQEVYSYFWSQKTISAENIIDFFRFPAVFESSSQKTINTFDLLHKLKISHNSSFEIPQEKGTERNFFQENSNSDRQPDIHLLEQAAQKLTAVILETGDNTAETGKAENGKGELVTKDLPIRTEPPGSKIGDYRGMAAWEQGQMDYEGSASSENIMNRLSFLIHQSV